MLGDKSENKLIQPRNTREERRSLDQQWFKRFEAAKSNFNKALKDVQTIMVEISKHGLMEILPKDLAEKDNKLYKEYTHRRMDPIDRFNLSAADMKKLHQDLKNVLNEKFEEYQQSIKEHFEATKRIWPDYEQRYRALEAAYPQIFQESIMALSVRDTCENAISIGKEQGRNLQDLPKVVGELKTLRSDLTNMITHLQNFVKYEKGFNKIFSGDTEPDKFTNTIRLIYQPSYETLEESYTTFLQGSQVTDLKNLQKVIGEQKMLYQALPEVAKEFITRFREDPAKEFITWFREDQAKKALIRAHHELVPDLSNFLSTIEQNIRQSSSLDQHQRDQYDQLLQRYQKYSTIRNNFEKNNYATSFNQQVLHELIVQDARLTRLVNDIVEEVKVLPSNGDLSASFNQPVSSNFLDNYVPFSDKVTMVRAYYMFDTLNEERNQLSEEFQQFLQDIKQNTDPSFIEAQMTTFDSLERRYSEYVEKFRACDPNCLEYINSEQFNEMIIKNPPEFGKLFKNVNGKVFEHVFDSLPQQYNQSSRLSHILEVSNLLNTEPIPPFSDQHIENCYQFLEDFHIYYESIKFLTKNERWEDVDSEQEKSLKNDFEIIRGFIIDNQNKLGAYHAFYSIRKELNELSTDCQQFLQDTGQNTDPSFSPEQMTTFDDLGQRSNEYIGKLHACIENNHWNYINSEQVMKMDENNTNLSKLSEEINKKRKLAAKHAADRLKSYQEQFISLFNEVSQSIAPNLRSRSPLSDEQIADCRQLLTSIATYRGNGKAFEEARHWEYLDSDDKNELESHAHRINEYSGIIEQLAQALRLMPE